MPRHLIVSGHILTGNYPYDREYEARQNLYKQYKEYADFLGADFLLRKDLDASMSWEWGTWIKLEAIKSFKDSSYDKMLWMDSDIVINKDLAYKLDLFSKYLKSPEEASIAIVYDDFLPMTGHSFDDFSKRKYKFYEYFNMSGSKIYHKVNSAIFMINKVAAEKICNILEKISFMRLMQYNSTKLFTPTDESMLELAMPFLKHEFFEGVTESNTDKPEAFIHYCGIHQKQQLFF